MTPALNGTDVNIRVQAKQAALEHFRAVSRDYILEPRLGIILGNPIINPFRLSYCKWSQWSVGDFG
jgi:hypothetical protein